MGQVFGARSLGLVAHLVEVVRRLLRDVEDRLELDLALGGEVRVGERLAKVLRERLVEVLVLLVGDVRRVARPQRLRGGEGGSGSRRGEASLFGLRVDFLRVDSSSHFVSAPWRR